MIYAPLSQNIFVKIYELFPQMFWDWKADSANFFTWPLFEGTPIGGRIKLARAHIEANAHLQFND